MPVWINYQQEVNENTKCNLLSKCISAFPVRYSGILLVTANILKYYIHDRPGTADGIKLKTILFLYTYKYCNPVDKCN